MTSRRSDDELIDMYDIAELLRVQYGTVRHWRSTRGLLPPPTKEFRSGPVWRRADIIAWAKETGRDEHLRDQGSS